MRHKRIYLLGHLLNLQRGEMIPRLMHRMWLGPAPMPQRFREYGRLWEELNPGWSLTDWSWHNLPEDLFNSDILDDISRRSRVVGKMSKEVATAYSDIIAFDLLYRFGGIYLDCDIQPVRPFLPEMKDGKAWSCWEDQRQRWVVNAAMAGCEGDPYWEKVLDELPRWYYTLRDGGEKRMNVLHGPWLLTRVYQNDPSLLSVFPHHVVNPVHWSQVEKGHTADGKWSLSSLPPDTIGVHHWDHRRSGRIRLIPERQGPLTAFQDRLFTTSRMMYRGHNSE